MNDQTKRRRIFSAAQRAGMVSRFRISGVSQREFAQEHGLKLTTFQSWLYGKRGASSSARRARFQEIKLFPSAVVSNSTGLVWAAEVEWSNGMKVRVSPGVDPLWLNSVVKQLGQAC